MKTIAKHRQSKSVALLALKVGGILLSLFLLVSLILLYLNKNNQQVALVDIVIAKVEIKSQQTVTADMLSVMQFEEGKEPPNTLRVDDATRIIGKKVLVNVQKGDLMTASFFGATSESLSAGLANTIREGKKVTYLKKDQVISFPPDLQKSNYIDIIAINQNDEARIVSDIILSRIEVFDVVRSAENNIESIELVGLELTDTQLLVLSTHLTEQWKLQISLQPQEHSINEASSSSQLLRTPVTATGSATYTNETNEE